MTKLYSYSMPSDDGAAPNPYWGVCTLAIGQPQIRATAEVGDWIAGTGSKRARVAGGKSRDTSGRLVYAMRVTHKMTMREYDLHTREHLLDKVPDWSADDRRLRLGDSLYRFDGRIVTQRQGVHGPTDKERDLTGKFVLLSEHFFYFGAAALELPVHVRAISDIERGHRLNLNTPLIEPFIAWIDGLGYPPCALLGEPLLQLFDDPRPRRMTGYD